jgi:GTP cyclohydrolase I
MIDVRDRDPRPKIQDFLPTAMAQLSEKVQETVRQYQPSDLLEALTRVAPETPVGDLDDRMLAEAGVAALLRLMGEDPERDGIRDTPKRVVKAYLEMASRPGDPEELLSRVFGDVGQSSEMICVPGIRFVSLSEHHLLPFTGTAAVAYIPEPGGAVVGLSKIPRLVHHWAMRPQVQERLTRQIADSLEGALQGALGVAVRIDSTHSCMSLRGVKADAASMVTTDLRGRFLENGPTRAEFMGEATRR